METITEKNVPTGSGKKKKSILKKTLSILFVGTLAMATTNVYSQGDGDGGGDGGDGGGSNNTPPSISCPSNISATLDSPINLGVPTVTFYCGQASIVHYPDYPPGGWPIGTTNVTWVATDVCGGSSYCIQTVTVTQAIPPPPNGLACYQTATYNALTNSWDVSGTQPAAPTTACYQTATFNNTTCSWDVSGTKPPAPIIACYETATFNNESCNWDVTGTPPPTPAILCYMSATFNTTTCSWEVTGTQPPAPTTACYETAAFNETSCEWEVSGTQPTEPTTACYETATFNNVTCSWNVFTNSCGNNKVTICHKGKNICISTSALSAHLAHGDKCVPCQGSKNRVANEIQSADISQEIEVEISPNPNNGNFIINFESDGETPITITVLNQLGQQVSQLKQNGSQDGINRIEYAISDLLPNGLYFIQLSNGSTNQVRKINVIRN